MAPKTPVNLNSNSARIHTDGGCWGNPGPGGWACIVELAGREIVASGGESATTNNRMELTAVIEGLRAATEAGAAVAQVSTDSRYVQQGITSWIHTWKKNGWRTAGKQPVKNQDLWIALDRETEGLEVRWEWVAGHAGNRENERCHDLVQNEIAKISK